MLNLNLFLYRMSYFITFAFLVRKIFTFYINDALLFKCPIPGPKGSIYSDATRQLSIYYIVRYKQWRRWGPRRLGGVGAPFVRVFPRRTEYQNCS